MELAGLEPATSWVRFMRPQQERTARDDSRSSRKVLLDDSRLQGIRGLHLEGFAACTPRQGASRARGIRRCFPARDETRQPRFRKHDTFRRHVLVKTSRLVSVHEPVRTRSKSNGGAACRGQAPRRRRDVGPEDRSRRLRRCARSGTRRSTLRVVSDYVMRQTRTRHRARRIGRGRRRLGAFRFPGSGLRLCDEGDQRAGGGVECLPGDASGLVDVVGADERSVVPRLDERVEVGDHALAPDDRATVEVDVA
jgi:hypothetical protein